MELHYWEKQLILYTKYHYGRIDYNKDLKRFSAELYGLGVENTDNYNVLGMVVRLYQKLVDAGHIRFNLEKYISDIFKRASFERGKKEVSYNDIIHQMLAEFQGLVVHEDEKEILELGEVDEMLKATIQKEINRKHVEDSKDNDDRFREICY